MRKEKHTPVAIDQPTVFVNDHGANGTFDVEELLNSLDMYGCDGMGRNLDDIMHDLTHLYTELEPGYTRAGELLYTLRILRNAVLKGGGYFDFPKQ